MIFKKQFMIFSLKNMIFYDMICIYFSSDQGGRNEYGRSGSLL